MVPIERYLNVFEGLRRRKRWSTGIEILRFAALTLPATDVPGPGSDLKETTKVLSKEAGRGGVAPQLGDGPRGGHADEVVPRVIEYRDRLREVKPRPTADIAFPIAAGAAPAQETQRMGKLEGARTAAYLRAVQAIVKAQHAAMIACMAACTVVVTSSSSSPEMIQRGCSGSGRGAGTGLDV